MGKDYSSLVPRPFVLHSLLLIAKDISRQRVVEPPVAFFDGATTASILDVVFILLNTI